MAFQISLFQIIFEQFLKISPDLISKYPTVQDQLLYLILIPHIVLFLFLVSFASWASGEHKRFQLLVSISAYIFIIWGGLYGTFLVPLTIFWFYISLGIGFVVFFLSRIIHPSKTDELFALGAGLHKKIREKPEKIKALIKEINKLNAQIISFGPGPHPPQQQQYINYLTSQKAALEEDLRDLES